MEHILYDIQNFNFAIAGLVLILYAITDALYAKYTFDVVNCNEYKAASVGALIHFFIAFGVINYTQNWLYIFPLAMGSWLGTFFLVRNERLKNTRNQKNKFQTPRIHRDTH